LRPIIEHLQAALALLDDAGESLAAIKIVEAIAILEASEDRGVRPDDGRSLDDN